MLILSEPAQSAPEGYENCTELNRYCVSPERTRIINGFPVHAACWQYDANHSCDKKIEVADSCALFRNSPTDINRTCSKTSQSCSQQNALRSSFCDEFENDWTCHYPFTIGYALGDPFSKLVRLDDPTYNPERQKFLDVGAEETYARLWIRPRSWRLVGKNTFHSFSTPYNRTSRSESQIKRFCSVRPVCTETPNSFRCISRNEYGSPEHRVYWRSHLGGSGNVNANCWRWGIDYNCRQEEFTNDCQHLHDDTSCTQQSVDCIANDEDGNYTNYVYEYQCGPNIEGLSTQICGSCLLRKFDFCTFNSRLARVLQEQGRSQFGIGWGHCRGLTPEELEMID